MVVLGGGAVSFERGTPVTAFVERGTSITVSDQRGTPVTVSYERGTPEQQAAASSPSAGGSWRGQRKVALHRPGVELRANVLSNFRERYLIQVAF